MRLPLHSRAKGHAMSQRLKGTENEVWIKYLTIMHRHKAMAPADWLREIEKAGKVKAKAYA